MTNPRRNDRARKVGRPTGSRPTGSDVRTILIQFRVNQEEWQRINSKAKIHGMSLAAWARILALSCDFKMKVVTDEEL